jgi:hypothetical protein
MRKEAHRQILRDSFPDWAHEVNLELIPEVLYVRKDALRLTRAGTAGTSVVSGWRSWQETWPSQRISPGGSPLNVG